MKRNGKIVFFAGTAKKSELLKVNYITEISSNLMKIFKIKVLGKLWIF